MPGGRSPFLTVLDTDDDEVEDSVYSQKPTTRHTSSYPMKRQEQQTFASYIGTSTNTNLSYPSSVGATYQSAAEVLNADQ